MGEVAVVVVTSGAVEADSTVAEARSAATTVAEAMAAITVVMVDTEAAMEVATPVVEAIPAVDMPDAVRMVGREPAAVPNPGRGLGKVVQEPEIPRPDFMDSLGRTQAQPGRAR